MKPEAQVVKRLRTAVCAAVAAKPGLRREYRRPPGWLSRRRQGNALRWVPTIAFGAAGFVAGPGPIVAGYAALWTLLVTFSRMAQLQRFSTSTDLLWPLYQLPVSNAAAAAEIERRWRRGNLWLAADWLLLGLGTCLHAPAEVWRWPLIPIAAGSQAMVAAALAAWMLRRWPRFPSLLPLVGSGLLLFACIQGYETAWLREDFILPLLKAVLLCTPGGWLAEAWLVAGKAHWPGWLAMISLGAAAALIVRPALEKGSEYFRMEALFGYDSDSPLAADVSAAGFSEDEGESIPVTPGPQHALAATSAGIAMIGERFRGHCARPTASALLRGPVESVVRRLLTVRERVVLDCIQPSFVWGWSRSWCIALAALVVSTLLRFTPVAPAGIVALTCLALGLFALPVFGLLNSGFDPMHFFQSTTGRISHLPLGYWECSRVLMKIAWLRLCAGLPLLLLGIRFALPVDLSWTETIDWGARVLIYVFALQPLWVVMTFSKTTNDSSARWWLTVAFVVMFFAILIELVISAVVMGGVDELGAAALMGVQLAVFTYGTWAMYGWAYRAGAFDLMGKPPSTES